MNRYCLSRVIVGAVFVKDQVDKGINARDGLELNASEDGAFECFWEGFFNFLCTC